MSQLTLRDEWWTPDEFFRQVEEKEGPFDLDAAASALNAKCSRFYSEEVNSLDQKWFGRVWCNPPYRKILQWVKKAHDEVTSGNCEKVVLLLPSDTSTQWFHFAFEHGRVEFLKGRLKFGGALQNAPWGCLLIVFEQEVIS